MIRIRILARSFYSRTPSPPMISGTDVTAKKKATAVPMTAVMVMVSKLAEMNVTPTTPTKRNTAAKGPRIPKAMLMTVTRVTCFFMAHLLRYAVPTTAIKLTGGSPRAHHNEPDFLSLYTRKGAIIQFN